MSNRTYSSVPTDLRGTANFPYIWDAGLVQTGGNQPITGNWRIFTTADVANNTINLTGASFSIQSVAVTGGSINVAGGSLAITNPILAISGIVSAPNGIIGIDTGNRSVAIVGTPSVTIANPVLAVSGNFGGGGFPTVLLTGNNLVGISGGTLNVSVTGGVISASSSSVSLTGFSPNLPPLPVSGAFSANIVDTGNRSVLVVNPVLAISGVVQANVSTVDTGNRSVFVVNPVLAVSGSFTSTPGNTAITGFNSTIPPLAISGVVNSTSVDTGNRSVFVVNPVVNSGGYVGVTGSVAVTNAAGFIGIDTGIRAVSIVSSINQFVVNSGGYTAVTGSVAVTNAAGFIGIDTGIRAVNLTNTSPIPISGVVNTSVTVGNVAITGQVAIASASLELALLSGIYSGVLGTSGQLAANLAGSAPVTGDIRNIPGTVLAISGVVNTTVSVSNVTITGFNSTIAPLAVSGNFGAVSVSNPIGVTGTAYDRNPILSGLGTYNFLPIGGRVANPSGAGALTGYATGAFAMLNLSPQGALFVSQGVLDKNYDQVTIFPASSGLLTTSIVSGAAPGPLSAGLVLPNNPNRRSWFIQNLGTGVLMVKLGATPPTTGNANIFLKGGTSGNDGLGATWSDDMGRWSGPVFVSGLNPAFTTLYTAWEL